MGEHAEGIAPPNPKSPITFVQSTRQMKTYTLTANEFEYLTKWNSLGKKSQNISTALFGVFFGFVEQAIFSMPTTAPALGILWVGMFLSLCLGLFYYKQSHDLEKASATVEATIKSETMHDGGSTS